MPCPICSASSITLHATVDSFDYYECRSCHSLCIDPSVVQAIDSGENIRSYDDSYWNTELRAAKQRAYGACLARMAESFYYLQIPMSVFLDIGTGPGYFLDAVGQHLPRLAPAVYGIEKFPPTPDARSTSDNYFIGDISQFPHKASCGLCMEVIEHLTPTMLKLFLEQLSTISENGALYMFNSGQPDFVKYEDSSYLDPTLRGHIAAYSIEGLRSLAEPLGFTVHQLLGKTWAAALEYKPAHPLRDTPLKERIWTPLERNIHLLQDGYGGSVFSILGLESARAYG